MRVFTVHLRRHGLIPEKDLVLVREGFAWTAFLFTFVWALWHHMWWAAAWIFIAVTGAGLIAETVFDVEPARIAVLLAVSAGVGFLADDLRRRHLAAQGFAEAGVVAGTDAEAALYRFLDQNPALARDLVSADGIEASAS